MASPFLWSPVAPDNQQQGTPSPFAGRNDFGGPNIFHQPAMQQYGGYQPQSVYDMPQGQASRQQAQQPQQPNIFHQTAPQQQNAQPVQNGIPQPNGGQSLSGLGQSIFAPQYGQYAPLASLQGLQGPAYNVNSNPMAGNARDGSFFLPWQQYGFGSIGF